MVTERIVSARGALSARLARFMAIFGAGSVIQLLLGLATTIVVTHKLTPTQFGSLSLYLLVPSLAMLLCNFATLRGTMHAVFGHGGGDEDVPDDDASAAAPRPAGTVDPRVTFCTGLVLTFGISLVVAAIAWPFADEIAQGLGGTAADGSLVRIGLFGGLFGSLWRVLTNFQRYARRPGRYVAGFSSRGAFVFVAMIVLLESGRGVEGAMWAYAVGTALACLVALVLVREDVRWGIERSALVSIPRFGVIWIPVSLSYHVVQGLSVYVVSFYCSLAQVGIYSLALSLARIAQYAVSTFIYSWGPLLRSPLHAAADEEEGHERLSGAVVSVYAVVASFMVLAIGVLADELVRIAPASFGSAAGLVPVLSLVPVGRGWLVAVYSNAVIANKRNRFIVLSTSAMFIFVGLSWPLGTWLGAYGVGLAGVLSFFIPALIMLGYAQRSERPFVLDYRQLLLAPLVAAALLLGELALHLGVGPAAVLVKLAFVAAFPLILVLTRTIPLTAVTALRRPVHLLTADRSERQVIVARLRTLTPYERGLLAGAFRGRQPLDGPQAEEAVELLGQVADVAVDPRLAPATERYLRWTGAAASRETLAQRLLGDGMDPYALDRLEQTVRQLRGMSDGRWSTAVAGGS